MTGTRISRASRLGTISQTGTRPANEAKGETPADNASVKKAKSRKRLQTSALRHKLTKLNKGLSADKTFLRKIKRDKKVEISNESNRNSRLDSIRKNTRNVNTEVKLDYHIRDMFRFFRKEEDVALIEKKFMGKANSQHDDRPLPQRIDEAVKDIKNLCTKPNEHGVRIVDVEMTRLFFEKAIDLLEKQRSGQ